jgi:flagellar basal body-associated protein FliL
MADRPESSAARDRAMFIAQAVYVVMLVAFVCTLVAWGIVSLAEALT